MTEQNKAIAGYEIRDGKNPSRFEPIITTTLDPNKHLWILDKIRALTGKRFYGKLTLMFEDGKITRGEILESIKP